MKINMIISQYRRDFTAIYECEHCGFTHEGFGYDDSYFHNEVIPQKECPQCKKKADGSYRPMAPKYPDLVTI